MIGKAVLRYEIKRNGRFVEEMLLPPGARLLHVKYEPITIGAVRAPFLYVIGNPEAKEIPRTFVVLETGERYEQFDAWRYVDSWEEGTARLHLFEVPGPT